MALPDVTNPGLPLTPYELDFALKVAQRIKLRAKIYERVEIEWRIDTRLMTLVIDTRALVFDRNQPDHATDEERAEAFRGQVKEIAKGGNTMLGDLAWYDAILPKVARPMVTRLPVRGSRPIRLTREMLRGSGKTLIEFLAAEARTALQAFVHHEIDELLLVDDRRHRDPHADDPGYAYTYKPGEPIDV